MSNEASDNIPELRLNCPTKGKGLGICCYSSYILSKALMEKLVELLTGICNTLEPEVNCTILNTSVNTGIYQKRSSTKEYLNV